LLQETPGVELSPNNPLLVTGIKVHNVYLENLVETGPVGLATWLLLVGVPTREIVRRQGWRANDSPWNPLLPMLAAFAFATMFLSITNNKILWIMIGLAATVPRLDETRVTGRQVAGAR
jgi:O-antigen ligase